LSWVTGYIPKLYAARQMTVAPTSTNRLIVRRPGIKLTTFSSTSTTEPCWWWWWWWWRWWWWWCVS